MYSQRIRPLFPTRCSKTLQHQKSTTSLSISQNSLSQFSSKSRVVVEFSECLKRKFPKKQSKEKHTRRILEKVFGVCDRVRWWA